MAYYRPDIEYSKAKKIVENLGDSEKDEAIKYYIEYHKKLHDKDKEKLEHYHNFFQRLYSFLPRNGGKIG